MSAPNRKGTGLGDALAVELVDRLGDSLVQDVLAADALVDDRRGHLAGSAGHPPVGDERNAEAAVLQDGEDRG